MLITDHYSRNANQNYSEYHLTLVRMTMIKNLQTINAGEGVEKREPSCTVRGNVNRYSHEGEVCVVLCLATRLCLTFCNTMDHSQPGSSVHGNSPGKNTGVGCHVFLQGIFPTQGSNPGLQHCRWIIYHLSSGGFLKKLGIKLLYHPEVPLLSVYSE